MKIPKRFKIMGHTVEVVTDSNFCTANSCMGCTWDSQNKIVLSDKILSDNEYKAIPKSRKEHTYLHEVVHNILSSMNEQDLNNNEKFVDTFAALLHQVLTTSEYV